MLLERAEQALEVALPRAMQVGFVDPDDPGAGVQFVVDGLAVTPFGTLHGAALAAVVELAGFLAVLPTLDLDEHAVTCHTGPDHAGPERSSVSSSGLNRLASTLLITDFPHLRAAHAGDRVEVHAQLDRRSRTMGRLTACWPRSSPSRRPWGQPAFRPTAFRVRGGARSRGGGLPRPARGALRP